MLRIDLSCKDEDYRKENGFSDSADAGPVISDASSETKIIPEADAIPPELPVEIEDHVRREIMTDLDASLKTEEPSSEESRLTEEEKAVKQRRTPGAIEKVSLSGSAPESSDQVLSPHAPPEAESIKLEEPDRFSGKPRFLIAGIAVMALGILVFFLFGRGCPPFFSRSHQEDASISPILPGPSGKPAAVPAESPVHTAAQAFPESLMSAPGTGMKPTAEPQKPVEKYNAVTPTKLSARSRPNVPRDPALRTLGALGGTIPPGVWLTTAFISADGAYELDGVAFVHSSLLSFASALEKNGSVSAKNIPVDSTLPDAMHHFSMAGKLPGMGVQDYLRPVSSEHLSKLAGSIRAFAGSSGVALIREPRAEAIYHEDDLPFEIEGLYTGVTACLGKFLAENNCAIYRMSVKPASPGSSFNRVRISFSIRTFS